MAFYGFARLVDEIGDRLPADRPAALDWIETETRSALDQPLDQHPLVASAARAVRDLGTDPAPLFALIEANRRDQFVTRYETFDELLGYCELSANPVGHLVLAALGHDSDLNRRLADHICTGLQLVEHWQDVREDARAGRIYLPAEDLRSFGIDPGQLDGSGVASPAFKALMVFESARARRLLREGAPLIPLVRGRARFAVAGFWAGGLAALDDIAAKDFDVLSRPAKPRSFATGRHLIDAFRLAREAA